MINRKPDRKKLTRIMVFGTFDLLHKGHLDFFRQARNLAKNPYLIVSVARDKNVKKIKGRKPKFLELARLRNVKRLKITDKAVLGGLKNYLAHIVREKPDVIALGYDQTAYTAGLRKSLVNQGLKVKIFRLKAHKPHKYKSSILKN